MPGLRRLCDPQGGAAHAAAIGRGPGQHRVHQRHRLFEPLPLLCRELRLPHDPRPRARLCHGREARQSRSRYLAGDRRRRWSVDRRQPSDARPSPEREHADHAVQQRDLRPHQGPGLAHQPRGHQVALDPDRQLRPSRTTRRFRAGCRRALRRPRVRCVEAPARCAESRACAPGRRLHRDLPELHRLQQGRVQRFRRAQGRRGPAAVAGRRQAHAVREGWQGHRARPRQA